MGDLILLEKWDAPSRMLLKCSNYSRQSGRSQCNLHKKCGSVIVTKWHSLALIRTQRLSMRMDMAGMEDVIHEA